MRVLLLNESPGADEVAREFLLAAREFNRGLDIRLRFLDVGFELREMPVPSDAEDASVRFGELLTRFQPSVVLALGKGPLLLECAAVAAKANSPIAFFVNGDPDRSARALARMAGILVVSEDGPAPAAAPGALICTTPPSDVAEVLVQTLVRSVKERRTS